MSEDTAKIRLKLGGLEVEYEGKSSFLKEDLFSLLQKTATLYAESRGSIPAQPAGGANGAAAPGSQSSSLDHSTNTIASHLGGSTCTDLVMAAAAHLALVKGKGKFTRQEISDEMKGATTYYKVNMGGNLSKSLDTLVRGKRLNQVDKGTYALSASERSSIEAKLAQ
jgi:hypothetical protein